MVELLVEAAQVQVDAALQHRLPIEALLAVVVVATKPVLVVLVQVDE